MLDQNSLYENEIKQEVNDESVAGDIGYFIWGLIQGLFLLLLSFILPPLAVALKGDFRQFAICLVLTILGFVPGIIYALAVIEIKFTR